jgi:hypothetical protein
MGLLRRWNEITEIGRTGHRQPGAARVRLDLEGGWPIVRRMTDNGRRRLLLAVSHDQLSVEVELPLLDFEVDALRDDLADAQMWASGSAEG